MIDFLSISNTELFRKVLRYMNSAGYVVVWSVQQKWVCYLKQCRSNGRWLWSFPLYFDRFVDHVKSHYMYFDFFLAFLTCCCIVFFCVFSLCVRKPSIPVAVVRMYNESLLVMHPRIVVWWTTTLKYQHVSVEEDLPFPCLVELVSRPSA